MTSLDRARRRPASSGRSRLLVLAASLVLAACSSAHENFSQQRSAQASAGEESSFAAHPLAVPFREARIIAGGVTLIPDGGVDLVPNIAIVEGENSVLVVDTGLGPRNGEMVYQLAREIAGGREIILTTTHFHPEHSFGAQAFKGRAHIVMSEAQAVELDAKAQEYIQMFSQFGEVVAEALEGTRITPPDQTYEDRHVLELGGREVLLKEIPGHTLGDQLIYVKDLEMLFAGDMVEELLLPIMPDEDSSGRLWLESLEVILEMDPKIVVPGHGAVGGLELVRAKQEYLQYVESEAQRLVDEGYSQYEVVATLTPALEQRYADWRNHPFIPFTVAIFYSEITGEPPQLPDPAEVM